MDFYQHMPGCAALQAQHCLGIVLCFQRDAGVLEPARDRAQFLRRKTLAQGLVQFGKRGCRLGAGRDPGLRQAQARHARIVLVGDALDALTPVTPTVLREEGGLQLRLDPVPARFLRVVFPESGWGAERRMWARPIPDPVQTSR